jgi:Zn-dependent protease with chaperone function
MKVFKLFLMVVLVPMMLLMLLVVKAIAFFKKKEMAGVEYHMHNMKAKAFVGTPIEALRGLGGVFLVLQTKEMLHATVRNKSLPASQRVIALMASPGYSVCVVKDIIPDFTKEELRAIIAHEFGHMLAGHLEQHRQDQGLLYSLDFEMEADDYAVAQVSAAAMKSALIKMRDLDIDRFDADKLADINHRIERL